jgi:hypothetical protein
MHHPRYFSGSTPSDFWLFSYLKRQKGVYYVYPGFKFL